ncbi:hypothetical protein JW805_20545 [Roseomonas aeriglobus]|nr:hypothetical protein [Roseomonas aeriglobus]MBN2974387.1 hypothetical protein [Roseomonas aeriglobus]
MAKWAIPKAFIGATVIYRFSDGSSSKFATQLKNASATTVSRSEYFIRPGSAMLGQKGDYSRSLFGILSLQDGVPGDFIYRRWRYGAAADGIWHAPVGQITSIPFDEYSNINGSPRTINGQMRVKLLGCADIRTGQLTEAAKVFRVVRPVRVRDVRSVPAVESITIQDLRYYISIRHGLMLRQDGVGGATIIDQILR